ncbi:MAG: SPOR domain-containing protein [Casimicrobiaceae bacterium]
MTAPSALRRPRRARVAERRWTVGGTLVGVFIGIVVGLGLAAGVAYWLMRNNPALSIPGLSGGRETPPTGPASAAASVPGKPRFDFYKILPGVEDAKPQPDLARAAGAGGATPATVPAAPRAAALSPGQAAGIAPGAGSTRDAARGGSATPPAGPANGAIPPAKPGARSWLQAGSFTTDADAENLKARLALSGLEASVQAGTLSDGSVRYRVRLGPYDNPDELSRMKTELAKRGFDVAVIRF